LRFSLASVLVLVLCFAASTGTATAKKKGGKNSVTVAKTAPTTLPPTTPRQPPGCFPGPPIPGLPQCTTPAIVPLVTVPLRVGKKAKGKVVSDNSVSITYTVTGPPSAGPTAPAPAGFVQLALTAPNGRTVFLLGPGFGDTKATTIGPVTLTPDSPFGPCQPDSSQSVTVCAENDPDHNVRPPNWAGTVGQPSLAWFGGVPARGTWTIRARNAANTGFATLNNVSITVGLASKPTSGKGK